MIQTIRIFSTNGSDTLGEGLLKEIQNTVHNTSIRHIQTTKIYRLEGVTEKQARLFSEKVLCEAINQRFTLNKKEKNGASHVVEIGYKPGVMNPEVASVIKTASDMGIQLTAADTSREYSFYGDVTSDQIVTILQKLHLVNKTVEQIIDQEPDTLAITGRTGTITTIPLRTMSDNELMNLSKNALFLNLEEMKVIQKYFKKIKRDPTDCELETLAQTWSEHCVHKTFRAKLTINGRKKQPLIKRIKATIKGHEKRIVSAFEDNSGVIDFYDGYGICGKVETHNSPSAIEPYGGAMTGSGGVFRDVLGTGQGAKVLVSTDIFCFAPPDLPADEVPPGCLPPSYLLKKVVAGVRDYGNRVGIPTNNGSIHFHKNFRAKPTVAVGAFGIIPNEKAQKQTPQPGDVVVTLGGRTGRDGIHGATFSSGEMSDQTQTVSGSAVQIGNAIEEKRMLDAIQTLRDNNLIRAITDCGAGGYSSAIGEMGKETGVTVHLEKVPLKYASLQPWEIFLSESQERMVLAVDPKHLSEVLSLCKRYNVEATVIGEFTASKRLQVLYDNQSVCDLTMDFLHDGLPQRTMTGRKKRQQEAVKKTPAPDDLSSVWQQIMRHGNVCSKEPIVRMYDHNVQGTSALHPFGGSNFDAPNDGAIIKPFLDKPYGLAVTHGLNPVLNSIDPYWGSIWALTEAVANYVSIGGDLKDAALIDNFIWPFPDEESLSDLDAAVDACTDFADQIGMPFVSGKDSLSSTYRYKDGTALKIPPVLLISVFGKIPDVTKTMSSDFKRAGSTIVLVGNPDYLALGGSTYTDILNAGGVVPQVDLQSLPAVLHTVTRGIRNGAILACHDVSEGGMAAALSEMCFGGEVGAAIDLSRIRNAKLATTKTASHEILFNETTGIFLVEVATPEDAELLFHNVPHAIIGQTTKSPLITVTDNSTELLTIATATLKKAWQSPMEEIFGSAPKPKICILRSDGTNCDEELYYAFEKAGAACDMVHVNELRNGEKNLQDFQLLALPGGFSYGDDIASGKVLAVELMSFFKDQLQQFVDNGGVVLGVCNGFQTLVRTGLLPFVDIGNMQVTLTHNDSGHFECRWVKIKAEESACAFLNALSGSIMDVAVNHGEGNFYAPPAVLEAIERQNLVLFRYVDRDGTPTQRYPDNPNGSQHAIAGICDPTGKIIGLMPHPEKFVDVTQHPNWRREQFDKPHGLAFFERIVSALQKDYLTKK
jgi:phosphoribosylformylglycinamidine synthase subunit PurSL